MELPPYIFGRQGGAHLENIHSLISNELLDFALNLEAAYKQIQITKATLTEQLYKRIQDEKDASSQNTLLNIKRDVFNERAKRIEKEINKNLFDQDTTNALEKYVFLLHQKSDHLQKGDIIYKNTVHKSIEHLEQLVAKDYFQNGILFASSTLDSKINNGNIKQTILTGKDKKLPHTLLKYFTRCVTKTTPFSSFNTIFCLEKNEQSYQFLRPLKRSHISINNLVFHYIKTAILRIPHLYRFFEVEVNPTLFSSQTHFHYFINQDNNDTFKKLKKSDITTYIIQFFEVRKIVQLKDLVKDLTTKVREPEDAIIMFLKKLIDEGLLILHYPAGINDPKGIEKVRCFIKNYANEMESDVPQRLRNFLEELVEVKRRLEANTSISERREKVNKTYTVFKHLDGFLKNRGLIAEDHQYFEKITSSDLFYEDNQQLIYTSTNTLGFEINYKALKALAQFAKATDIKSHIKENCKRWISDFTHSNKIPCLKFLEKIYYPHVDQIFGSAHEMIHDQTRYNLAATQRKIIQKLKSHRDAKSADLKPLLNTKHFHDNSINDFSVYCQFVHSSEQKLMVINEITSGYGKSNSRFLNLYPDTVCKSYKDKIANKYPHALVAEIRDASIHNTNKFPKLADAIIDIPGSGIDTSNYNKISMKDLQIVIDDAGDMVLQTNSGKCVIPIDFSMENPKRKSSLVKFFDLFNPSPYLFGLQYSLNTIDHYFKTQLSQSDTSIVRLPRLHFGDDIVIQRQKWLVKKSVLMDLITKHTSDNQKFINYYNFFSWAKEHKIPEEVFIKIQTNFDKSSDHCKPQYINFNMPLLVQYFETILPKADEIFEITEMLPGTKDISNDVHSNGFVKEYILNYM